MERWSQRLGEGQGEMPPNGLQVSALEPAVRPVPTAGQQPCVYRGISEDGAQVKCSHHSKIHN